MLPFKMLTAFVALLVPAASAIRLIESTSLVPCMKNSSFFASKFHVVFTPNNATITYEINGFSKVSSKVVLGMQVTGYGYPIANPTLDPCKEKDLKGLCPMTSGDLPDMKSNFQLDKDVLKQIPTPIYYIPDLDGKVRVWINSTEGDRRPLACVEAEIRNGKTVNQRSISWVLAVIIGLCLVVSGFMSGYGHFITSAHVAAKALAVMCYFQSQALIGMTAVTTPPIVRAWTQDFVWSMGIVATEFHQTFATWYQRATGGQAAHLLASLDTTSVHVQKRATPQGEAGIEIKTVKGMERVSFLAGIEITNTFFTAYTFFIFILFLVSVGVIFFKGFCELCIRSNIMNRSRFEDFRNGWKLILKGILFRIILIGCTPMIVMCLWEFTRRDSSAEVVLAVWMLLFIISILTIATVKIWKIAHRSMSLHKSPAYILYADPTVLNKWGFLYIHFKATMTPFLIVQLLHALVRGAFIGLAQKSGPVQVVALIILEVGLFIAVCIIKPFMDKKTNAFNISIMGVNAWNVLLLLLLSDIFHLPPLAVGILGVLYFVVNAIFAGIILIMTIIACIYACTSKNPDARYTAIADDRTSFVKSTTNLETTELDALGRTARGASRTSFLSALEKETMHNQQHPRSGSRNGFHSDSQFYQHDGGSVDQVRHAPVRRMDYDSSPFRSDPSFSVGGPSMPGQSLAQAPPSFRNQSNLRKEFRY